MPKTNKKRREMQIMDLIKIGKYISGKRKELGLTQKQLAEKLDKSDKSVSKWERGICLPDVSVYMELCSILNITINEFLAGEDIDAGSVAKKSEDTLIQVSKDSNHKQSRLKRIIAALLILLAIFLTAAGGLLYNRLQQPKNYIEPFSNDSPEIKTAKLFSGTDQTMMFKYNTKDSFKEMNIYLSEYRFGKRISHKNIAKLTYDKSSSANNGIILITPNSDYSAAKLVITDETSQYSNENKILENVTDRKSYMQASTLILNTLRIKSDTEQRIATLMYGKNSVSTYAIQHITKNSIDGLDENNNDYILLFS